MTISKLETKVEMAHLCAHLTRKPS